MTSQIPQCRSEETDAHTETPEYSAVRNSGVLVGPEKLPKVTSFSFNPIGELIFSCRFIAFGHIVKFEAIDQIFINVSVTFFYDVISAKRNMTALADRLGLPASHRMPSTKTSYGTPTIAIQITN